MEGTTLEPGTLIEHRYLIRRFIAAGGVAQVYAATHRITGREVALKMPRTDGVRDPLVHERLLREGHAVARARHPGVVEIVDAGQYQGAPYLVMDTGASIAPYNHFELGQPILIEYVWGRQVGENTINP